MLRWPQVHRCVVTDAAITQDYHERKQADREGRRKTKQLRKTLGLTLEQYKT